MSTLEIIADDGNVVGEGPIWDVARQRLLWTDIESGLVYQIDAAGEKSIISRDLIVGAVGLNDDGRLIFSGRTGVHLWRGQDDYKTLLSEVEGETLNFNDAIIGPNSRLYAGTVYWGDDGMEKLGKLYLIAGDGSAKIVVEDIELSNGLGFSPDDRTLYYTDTIARKIYAFDVDAGSGELANKRVFVTVPDDEGIPDGMTVDAQGFVWSAQWYGEQVVRYDPDGAVERRIPMPVQQVSCVMFGGPDLTDLYISSAAYSWPSDFAPPGYDFNAPNIGGALYRLRVDVQGKPEHVASWS
jgi:sugar lactone lactonase YvrE